MPFRRQPHFARSAHALRATCIFPTRCLFEPAPLTLLKTCAQMKRSQPVLSWHTLCSLSLHFRSGLKFQKPTVNANDSSYEKGCLGTRPEIGHRRGRAGRLLLITGAATGNQTTRNEGIAERSSGAWKERKL
jgi:hypothetical protein